MTLAAIRLIRFIWVRYSVNFNDKPLTVSAACHYFSRVRIIDVYHVYISKEAAQSMYYNFWAIFFRLAVIIQFGMPLLIDDIIPVETQVDNHSITCALCVMGFDTFYEAAVIWDSLFAQCI